MSKLEQSVISLVDLFNEYAGKDQDKNNLSSVELKQLLEKELSKPEFKKKFNADQIKEVMAKLDKNQDGQINFQEFCQLVGTLARGYYTQTKAAK